MTRAAFTLIELSIVLVILGLIVGAIVGGKSLIHAAEIQNIVRDSQAYTTAYNAFIAQYDAKPGDFAEGYDYWGGGVNTICGSNDSNNNGCNGNGDGILGTGTSDQAAYAEGKRAWMHMQLADILPSKVQFIYGTTRYDQAWPTYYNGVYMNNIPQAKGAQGDAGWDFWNPRMFLTWWPSGMAYGKNGAWLELGSAWSGWNHFNAALSSRDAAAIDKKLDDGLPVAGRVTAENSEDRNGACESSGGWYAQETENPNATYVLDSPGPSCHMFFYIGD